MRNGFSHIFRLGLAWLFVFSGHVLGQQDYSSLLQQIIQNQLETSATLNDMLEFYLYDYDEGNGYLWEQNYNFLPNIRDLINDNKQIVRNFAFVNTNTLLRVKEQLDELQSAFGFRLPDDLTDARSFKQAFDVVADYISAILDEMYDSHDDLMDSLDAVGSDVSDINDVNHQLLAELKKIVDVASAWLIAPTVNVENDFSTDLSTVENYLDSMDSKLSELSPWHQEFKDYFRVWTNLYEEVNARETVQTLYGKQGSANLSVVHGYASDAVTAASDASTDSAITTNEFGSGSILGNTVDELEGNVEDSQTDMTDVIHDYIDSTATYNNISRNLGDDVKDLVRDSLSDVIEEIDNNPLNTLTVAGPDVVGQTMGSISIDYTMSEDMIDVVDDFWEVLLWLFKIGVTVYFTLILTRKIMDDWQNNSFGI